LVTEDPHKNFDLPKRNKKTKSLFFENFPNICENDIINVGASESMVGR
jgi:hypothetical protein